MCQLTNKKALLLVFFLCYSIVYAQKEISFEKLVSCEVLNPNSSIEETREKAVIALKILALQKAGISEIITSNQYLEVKNNPITNSDAYYESTFSDLQGEISFFSPVGFEQKIGEAGEILICVSANVSVIKYEDMEREIPSVQSIGINSKYKNNELLNFKIASTKKAYCWVFFVDEKENYTLLFPTNDKQNHLITPGIFLELPDKTVKWVLNTTSADQEKNSILIVTHPSDIPVKNNSVNNFNSWANWYKQLDFRKKTKQIFNFLIYAP